jgi:hypothetical protein
VIWILTSLALLAWLAGLLLGLGAWVNLLLLVAATLLVYAVISEREPFDPS